MSSSPSILSRYLDPETVSGIDTLEFLPEDLVVGNLAGHHRSPLSGFAIEFAGHREYVWGDDPRHIDWRVFYLREKLFIKQYEMETNFVGHLVVDISASMRYGTGDSSKLAFASRFATVLGFTIVRQSDQVSLALVDEKVRDFVRPGNSLAQIIRFTEQFDAAKSESATSLSNSLDELAGLIGRRGIVLIFSDFLTDLDLLELSLRRLLYSRHEVVLLQVLHADEIDFKFDGTIKFRGLEEALEEIASPGDIRKAYLKEFSEFQSRLDQLCQRNQIERIVCRTDQKLSETIINYLVNRQKT